MSVVETAREKGIRRKGKVDNIMTFMIRTYTSPKITMKLNFQICPSYSNKIHDKYSLNEKILILIGKSSVSRQIELLSVLFTWYYNLIIKTTL